MKEIIELIERDSVFGLSKHLELLKKTDDEGNTALSIAFDYRGSDAMINALLKVNNYKQVNNLGISPFEKAVIKGRTEWVKKFIEMGVDVNHTERESNFTALMGAVTAGRTEIVKILLENGAYIHEKDSFGFSPLDFARKMKKEEILKILEEEDLKR